MTTMTTMARKVSILVILYGISVVFIHSAIAEVEEGGEGRLHNVC